MASKFLAADRRRKRDGRRREPGDDDRFSCRERAEPMEKAMNAQIDAHREGMSSSFHLLQSAAADRRAPG